MWARSLNLALHWQIYGLNKVCKSYFLLKPCLPKILLKRVFLFFTRMKNGNFDWKLPSIFNSVCQNPFSILRILRGSEQKVRNPFVLRQLSKTSPWCFLPSKHHLPSLSSAITVSSKEIIIIISSHFFFLLLHSLLCQMRLMKGFVCTKLSLP